MARLITYEPANEKNLTVCCAVLFSQMVDMDLKPGREDWVRHPETQSELIAMVRQIWVERFGGHPNLFPWNTHYVVHRFIQLRKQGRAKVEGAAGDSVYQGLFCSDEGWVYFIGNEQGHVKIGYTSTTPLNRLKQLQTGSSGHLDLLAAMRGNQDKERALHLTFASQRIRPNGEWFYRNEDIQTLIRKHSSNASK